MKKLIITVTNNISYDQRMLKIAQHYSADFEVVMVGSSTRKPPPLEPRDFQQIRLKTFANSGFLFYAEFNIRLLFTLFSMRPDVLYAVDLDTIGASYFYNRIKRTPYIYDAHEYFTELPELEGRTFVQRVWRFIERKAIPRARRCLTVNEELAGIYSGLYQKEFVVVQNTPQYHSTLNIPKEKRFIYQGALNKGRGVEELISIMKYFPDYTLDIAGDGPMREVLENLRAKQGAHNVVFHGMLKAQELSVLTHRATIGFNLLLGESLNYYYSLANKFFDYVMAEVPVITMDFPVYRRLMIKFQVGKLVTELEEEKLANVVQTLVSNKSAYESAIKNCKLAKEKWNWSKESEGLDELIKGL